MLRDIADDQGMAHSRSLKSALAGALVAGPLLVAAWGAPAQADGGGGGAIKIVGASYSQELAFANCMRGHGEPSFPDPNSDGVFSLNGIDPNSSQYRQAEAACQHLLPKVRPPTPAEQAKLLEKALAYSNCMRRHGEPELPRPQLQRRWHQLQFEGRRPQLTAVPAGTKRLPGSVPVPGRRAGCALNKAVARRWRGQKIPRRRKEVQLHSLVRRHDKNLTKGSARALVATAPAPITQSSQVGHINGAKSAGRG